MERGEHEQDENGNTAQQQESANATRDQPVERLGFGFGSGHRTGLCRCRYVSRRRHIHFDRRAAVRTGLGSARVFGSAVRAGNHFRQSRSRLHHLPSLARLALLQIRAALRTRLRCCRVARAAKPTVDVCPGFRRRDHFFIGDQFLFRRALELNILRLGCAAVLAVFYGSGVAPIAVGADPLQLHNALASFLHVSLLDKNKLI